MDMLAVNTSDLVDRLERRHLDRLGQVTAPPIWGELQDVSFLHIRGLASFWKSGGYVPLAERLDDLLASACGIGLAFQFLLVGQKTGTSLFMALEGSEGESSLRSMLHATFPGIIVNNRAEQQLGKTLNEAGLFGHQGIITGIPSRKSCSTNYSDSSLPSMTHPTKNTPAKNTEQIERLIRGLQGETWGFWVRAVPVRQTEIVSASYSTLQNIAAVASQTKRQLQKVTQEMEQVQQGVQRGSTESMSVEILNREAEYVVELLEKQLQRIDQAKATGMWKVDCRFFSNTQLVVQRVQSLARAVFSGSESTPDALRTFICSPDTSSSTDFQTILTTPELATYAQLPREEFQGFRIAPYARFDTDLPLTAPVSPIIIGRIVDINRVTNADFSIPLEDLAKHALVTGMTGSGKTTTIFGVLEQLFSKNIPFLIIEPAKAEYRHLLGADDGKSDPSGPIPTLRVYTLGDETVAPFRLNPFEFEIIDENRRIHLQTHIDYLKSVFNAAFILYAPMPYVLETCLHEIYTDRGWDLTSGLNLRLGSLDYSNATQWSIFPTLSDLYHKVDEVVNRLGYEARIEMDVKAGLKARIGSLLLGSKGLMLNCRSGVPFSELLDYPTVLELERIGNDDEKAFIIGLVLTRLYEYRRLSVQGQPAPDFQHLTIVEEAHRLLKNVPTEVQTEGANTRGQAVETFANMLSEIRSYGEGILIAEQIPTKLTPDAVKNTNLKIVHRLVATDDREVMAGAMNMGDEQSQFLTTLPRGFCSVYAEQADYPYLIMVNDTRSKQMKSPTSDRGVSLRMKPLITRQMYEPASGYWNLVRSGNRTVSSNVDGRARLAIEKLEFTSLWSALMLHIIYDPSGINKSKLNSIQQFVRSITADCGQSEEQEVLRSVLVYAAEQSTDKSGQTYHWLYTLQSELHELLSVGLINLVNDHQEEARTYLTRFVTRYRAETTVVVGPHAGCEACKVRCWLKLDVNTLASQKWFQQDIVQLVGNARQHEQVIKGLADLTSTMIERWMGKLSQSKINALSTCLLAQATEKIGFSHQTQAQLTSETGKKIARE